MTKYCTNCGKKLEDGKTCDCMKKTTKKNEAKEEAVVVKTTSNEMVNDYLDVLKGVFVTPASTMKKYATSSKFVLALIMLGINSIIFGLFVYLFAKEGIGLIASFYGSSYSSLVSGYDIEVPAKVFFIALVLMLAFFFCLGGLLHLIAGPIMKKDSDFKSIMGLIGVNAVFTTITTLVALVCIYINLTLGIVVLAIASTIYLFNTYQGFIELSKIDKNKVTYVFTVAYAITIFVVCYLLPKIFS